MNTIRMFVFVVAVLTMAFLSRVISAYFSYEQSIHTATAAHGAAATAAPPSAADPSSPQLVPGDAGQH
jgi:hypothetical protein